MFIINVSGVLPVLSKTDVDSALSAALVESSGESNATVIICFAINKSYYHEGLHSSMTNAALQSDQICRIATIVQSQPKIYPPHHDICDTGEHVADLPMLDNAFAAHLDD